MIFEEHEQIPEGLGAIYCDAISGLEDYHGYMIGYTAGTEEERLAKAIVAALDGNGVLDVVAFRAIWEDANG